MEGWLVSFILASASSLLWTALPTPLLTTIYFLCSVLVVRFSNHSLLTGLSGFFAGLVWISSVGHWHQHWQLQVNDFNQTVLIEGEISSLLPNHEEIKLSKQNTARFNIQIKSIDGEKQFLAPYNFRLSWHKPTWVLKQGQNVQLLVKLKPAHGLANEGGFHYQQWLFTQQIQATGYVKTNEQNKALTTTPSIRQQLLDKILSFELSHQRWLVALSLGYRGLLDQSDWQILQATGTSHLVAISGLHVAVVAALAYACLFKVLGILMRFGVFKASISCHRIALLAALSVSLFYAYLAGFSIPTVRAWVMMLVISSLILFNQSWSKIKILSFLVFVVIFCFPLSLYGVSFWLSFFAVSIILFSLWRFPFSTRNDVMPSKLLAAVRMQLLLSVIMLPIVAWQFSILSFSAPFINLIAVPLVTILLVPICVLSCFAVLLLPTVAEFGFIVANKIVQYGVEALSYSGATAYAQVSAPPFYVWCCLFVFIIIAFLPRLPVPKYLVFIWLLPILSVLSKQESEKWQVDIIDVGQGLAVLISKHGQAILYDTGPSFPSGFNTAEAAIIPLLKSRSIDSLDLLIISHNDNDHAGGLAALKLGLEVKRVISSEDECINGWQYHWQGLLFEALWPREAMSADENEASCVIKISDDKHTVLLTGDIDKRVERKLIGTHSSDLRSTLLVVPHHGSNSSSSDTFIKQVMPSYVVFSQGFLNRWNFPRPEVVDRYKKYDVSMFSTSTNGQVSFVFSEEGIQIKRFRQEIHPYWYANHPKD